MKKNILFTLAASVLLLTACVGGNPSSSSGPDSSDPEATSQATGASTGGSQASATDTGSGQATVETIEVVFKLGDGNLKVGDTAVVGAKINGADSTAVTWSSSAASVATVENGVITAASAGEADITATSTVDPTKSASVHIVVSIKVTNIGAVLGTEKSVTVRGKVSARTKGHVYLDDGTGVLALYYKAGTTPDADYAIGKILTVTGEVKKAFGEVEFEMDKNPEIVIEQNAVIASMTIDTPETLTADKLATYAAAGEMRSVPVTFVATAVNGTNNYVNWKIGDYFLSYQKKPDEMPGLVADIEYTVKGYLSSYNSANGYFPVVAVEVQANQAVDPVADMVVDQNDVSVPVGDSVTVVATVTPETCNQKVHWKVEEGKEDIVKVKDGKITGLAEGTAKVIATTDGENANGEKISREINVTVTAAVTAQLPMEGDFSDLNNSTNKVLPYGWTQSGTDVYSGGLKANSDGWNVTSREFAPSNTGVEVDITVKEINGANGTAGAADEALFKVEGLNAEGEAVAEGIVLQSAFVEEADHVYHVVVNGVGIVKVKVTLAKRPACTLVSGKTTYNLKLSKIEIAAGTYDPSAAPDAATVELNHETLDLVAGRTGNLTATVGPDGASQRVVWSTDDAEVATVENGVVTAVAAGTAHIRATAEGHDDVYAECTVTVTADTTNWGTPTAPLTVAEARAICDALADKASTDAQMYVTGTVKSRENANTVWITDGENDFELYHYTLDTDVDDPAVGDTVISQGKGKKFGTTLEQDSPKIIGVTRGSVAITLGDHEHATVTGLPTENVVNGSEITFNVVVEQGYELVSVKAGSKTLTGDGEGNYSFVAAGPAEIVVTTQAEGFVATSMTITADSFDDFTSTYADYTGTVDGVTLKADACYNGGDGIQMRTNATTGDSKVYNTVALPKAIAKITIHCNVKFTNTKTLLKLAVGTSSQAAATDGVSVVKSADSDIIEIVPNSTDATYFNLFHTKTSGACYIDSIVIEYVAD